VTDLFAGSGDLSRATFWTGLRPMTPDGPPPIGATRYRSLYLSTGLARWAGRWRQAQACARRHHFRPRRIDLAGLTVERYA
jgi:D-amino-acid dehydrogenase